MAIDNFLAPLLGGALIGLSATLLLFTLGRVAGVSGIIGRLATPARLTANWRLGFVLGLLVAGWLSLPRVQVAARATEPALLIVAGLLVGIGTRLGNGCTSGHGICGLSRLSNRSIVATCIFMGTAMFVVAIARRAFAGGSP